MNETPQPQRQTHWKKLMVFSLLAIAFWIFQIVLQYYLYTERNTELALLRGDAFSAATLISLSLFVSTLFKWFPRTAKHWRYRRYLGVSGVVFASLHIVAALRSVFAFDLSRVYSTWDPFVNPIVFTTIAYPILLVMAFTSTDSMVRRLTAKRWKTIHRFVYLAYWGIIFHTLLMNPSAVKTIPGALLLIIMTATVFSQIYWFFRTAVKRRFRSPGSAVGIGLILLTILTAVFAYLA